MGSDGSHHATVLSPFHTTALFFLYHSTSLHYLFHPHHTILFIPSIHSSTPDPLIHATSTHSRHIHLSTPHLLIFTTLIHFHHIHPSTPHHHLQIHMVSNRNSNKPRGYAFIEYNHERDMHCMYQIGQVVVVVFYDWLTGESGGGVL